MVRCPLMFLFTSLFLLAVRRLWRRRRHSSRLVSLFVCDVDFSKRPIMKKSALGFIFCCFIHIASLLFHSYIFFLILCTKHRMLWKQRVKQNKISVYCFVLCSTNFCLLGWCFVFLSCFLWCCTFLYFGKNNTHTHTTHRHSSIYKYHFYYCGCSAGTCLFAFHHRFIVCYECKCSRIFGRRIFSLNSFFCADRMMIFLPLMKTKIIAGK